MKFLSVEIQNFLSYGEKQKIQLANRGLVSVVGVNKDTSGASSNGAGKSSLNESIVWALYGITMRGYKGDAVINRTVGKDCQVTLVIEDGTTHYTVIRTRKAPRKRANDLVLLVNGVDVSQGINADTQQQINTLIGMDSTTFTQSVMMWHGTQSFSQMTDKEQKGVLEDILQIDVLSKAQGVVRTRLQDKRVAVRTVETELAQLDDAMQTQEQLLHKLQDKHNQHAHIALQRKRDLKIKKLDVEIQIEEAYTQTGLDKLIKTRDNLIKQVEDVGSRQSHVQTEKFRITRLYAEQKSAYARTEGTLHGQLTYLQEELTALHNLVGHSCPTCKQFLPVTEAEATIQQWEKAKKRQYKELGDVQAATRELAKREALELHELATQESNLRTEASSFAGQLQIATHEVNKRAASLSLVCDLEQRSRNIQEEIDAIDTSSPYSSLIEEAERTLTEKRGRRRTLSCQVKSLQFDIRHLEYWDKGFGNHGLKSYLLDEVIPFLTFRAQEYLDILSGGDIQIEFSTQTALKSGDLKDSFQVIVTNTKGADVYHGNSDGERRRVDIAVGWALADLAATRAKKHIAFRGLDEPFEHLDEVGEDLVMKLLHQVLPQYETIMCVTHSAHLRSQFLDEIVITFENGFSKVS